MSEDLDDQLSALSEQIVTTELIARENRKELLAIKQLIEQLTKRADRSDELFKNDKDAITEIQENVEKMVRTDAEQQTAVDKIARAIAEVESRLSGQTLTGLSEQLSYEKLASIALSLRSRLSGESEGQMSYESVRRSIEDTRFLGKVVNWLIGIFGIGAFVAILRLFLGGEDITPSVLSLQKTVEYHTEEIQRLDSRFEGDLADRLRRMEDNTIKK